MPVKFQSTIICSAAWLAGSLTSVHSETAAMKQFNEQWEKQREYQIKAETERLTMEVYPPPRTPTKFKQGVSCTTPQRIGEDGLCLKDCIKSAKYMEIKIKVDQTDGNEHGECTRRCPTNNNYHWETVSEIEPTYFDETVIENCNTSCRNGHFDYQGYCIPNCPTGDKNEWEYNTEVEECEYPEFNEIVNASYIPVTLIAIPSLLLCLFMYYYFYILAKRKLYPIEEFLAVVMAKLHNSTKGQSNEGMVKMGLGKDEKVIKQWVEDIWETYVIDCDEQNNIGGMSKEQFQYFFRTSFLVTGVQFSLLYKKEDTLHIADKRFKLFHGRITKRSMYNFLERLRWAKEPQSLAYNDELTDSQIKSNLNAVKTKAQKARQNMALLTQEVFIPGDTSSRQGAFLPQITQESQLPGNTQTLDDKSTESLQGGNSTRKIDKSGNAILIKDQYGGTEGSLSLADGDSTLNVMQYMNAQPGEYNKKEARERVKQFDLENRKSKKKPMKNSQPVFNRKIFPVMKDGNALFIKGTPAQNSEIPYIP